MMKHILLMFIISLILFNCKSDAPVVLDGDNVKQIEGWAGEPDNIGKKPFDYFYMKSLGRASNKAIEKRSGAMMQTTCADAAVTGAKGNIVGKLIGETLTGASGTDSGESTGVVVVREFAGNLKGINVKECKPLFEDEANTPYSGWKECECVVFAKIPGGKEALIAKAEKIKN